MALLWMDGFDYYNSIPGQYDSNSSWGTGFSINAAGRRNGTQGIQMTSGIRWARKNFSPGSNTLIIGAALNIANVPSANLRVLYFLDSGSYQCEVGINPAGHIFISRNGTVLATSTASISVGAWQFWEFKVTISNTGSAEVRINGVSFVTFSGDTQNTANASANQFQFGMDVSGTGLLIDDVYVVDSTGTVNNDYLGDVKVLAAFPASNAGPNQFTQNYGTRPQNTAVALGTQILDSNGNVQEATTAGTTANNAGPTWNTTGGGITTDGTVVWTCRGSGTNPGAANWMAVSEINQDGDSSYVVSATVGNEELYGITPLTGSSVLGTMVTVVADKDDTSTRSIRTLVQSGATVVDNGSDHTLNQSTYTYYNDLYPNDPATGSPWASVAAVNAAKIGVKMTA